ncbi:MAG: maltose-binding protein [Acidimicrobiaceae bacterium]|jgi:multiple sugar transport system substrate-binding protein|nr:maltose-binding protein [Acidimicrobiaceae bacterium]
MGGKQARKGRVLQAALACTALGATSTLVGMANAGASARPHSKATVTLKFWNAYNTVTETPVLNKIVIPAFEKANPGIKVEDVNLPYAGLLQKFIASSAAGNPPDLMRSDIAWVPQLASEGTLLETSAQSWFAPIKAASLPGPLSTNKYKGNYYGLPDDTNTQVLFWNKADFSAAGLSGPPTTLAELWKDAQTLTVQSKGQFGLGVDSTDIWNVSPYIWSDGGSFTNSSLTSATGYMNGHATVSALTHLYNLEKAGVIGSDFKGGAGAVSGETGFPKGQYAMYLDGPWATTTYKQAGFTGYGTALVPSGSNGHRSVVGGEDLVIAKGGKNLADTVKLVKFLSSPFAQLAMSKAGDMAAYKTDTANEVAADPSLKIFAQQLLTAVARPVTQGYPQLDTDFSNELAEVLAGNASVQNAMNVAAQQADSALLAHS